MSIRTRIAGRRVPGGAAGPGSPAEQAAAPIPGSPTLYRLPATDDDPGAILRVSPRFLGDHGRRELVRAARRRRGHRHERLVGVRGVELAADRPYVVLEPAAGDLLSARLQAGSLAPWMCVSVLQDAAEVLQALARRGLRQVELTPGDILVDGGRGLLLGDVGLFREALHVAPSPAELPYLAPERSGWRLDARRSDTDGRFGRIARRGDEGAAALDDLPGESATVYSLGCVLFHALTGSPPYDPDGTPTEIAAAQLALEPPRPSERRPELPPQMDDVIARALGKVPGERFATPVELMRAALAALPEPAARRAPTRPSAAEGPPKAHSNGVHPPVAPEPTWDFPEPPAWSSPPPARPERTKPAGRTDEWQVLPQPSRSRYRYPGAGEDTEPSRRERRAAERQQKAAARAAERERKAAAEAAERDRKAAERDRKAAATAAQREQKAAARAAKREQKAAKPVVAPAAERARPDRQADRRGLLARPATRALLAATAVALCAAAGVAVANLTESQPPAPPTPQRVTVGDARLTLPVGWGRAPRSTAPFETAPGELVVHRRGLAGAGLVLTQSAAARASTAGAEPVSLGQIAAWRYPEAEPVPGTLADVYVVPSATDPVRVVCFARADVAQRFLPSCGRVAATLAVTAPLPLTGDEGARAGLVRTLRSLERRRVAGRRRLAAAATQGDQARAGRDLATAYARAASATAALPPVGAPGDRGGLVSALRAAKRDYSSLANAAAGRDRARFASAREAVAGREAEVRAALKKLAAAAPPDEG